MILAFDTYYFDNVAKTVVLAFQKWEDEVPLWIESEITQNIAPYQPGEFYKRELPCLIHLLAKLELKKIEYLIIDGYCILDDYEKYGLGGHLYEALHQKIPIIGVAKTRFKANTKYVKELYRGQSKKALFITSIGVELPNAYDFVKKMHGAYRIPTLLSILDQETKK